MIVVFHRLSGREVCISYQYGYKKDVQEEGSHRRGDPNNQLTQIGVTTKSDNKTRQEKFGHLRTDAQDRQNAKPKGSSR